MSIEAVDVNRSRRILAGRDRPLAATAVQAVQAVQAVDEARSGAVFDGDGRGGAQVVAKL